jgi:hypothetical protein
MRSVEVTNLSRQIHGQGNAGQRHFCRYSGVTTAPATSPAATAAPPLRLAGRRNQADQNKEQQGSRQCPSLSKSHRLPRIAAIGASRRSSASLSGRGNLLPTLRDARQGSPPPVHGIGQEICPLESRLALGTELRVWRTAERCARSAGRLSGRE